MPSQGFETPIPANLFVRLSAATRFVISGVTPDSWFGPQQPLAPQAPPEVNGRQWDYPFGVNLSYGPRSESAISFHELRALADALPLLRAVIETCKDQIAALNYTVRPRDPRNGPADAARIADVLALIARPDRRHDFATWLRMLVEDMLVIDAACIYPRFTRGGALYSLDVIDGSTISPLIGDDGRASEPGVSKYQEVLPRLSTSPARRARRRLHRRRTAVPPPQPALAPALRLEPGRADRADDQHRPAARAGDARVLERNAPLVDLVASGNVAEQWLEVRFGSPTGVEAVMTDISLQPNMRQAFNVGVLIVQDARQSRGYRVKTAYPLNDVPGENRSDR